MLKLLRRLSLLAPWVLITLHFVPAARADVYLGWSDADVPAFSDRPHAGFQLFLRTDDLPATSPARAQSHRGLALGWHRFGPDIAAVAAENDLPQELLHAVIQVESGYNPAAVSRKGAVGLMQLMPATARRFGVTDRRDPLANLRGGARYLRELISLFGGDVSLALAAYNAGESKVIRHAPQIPPYPETVAYVRAVIRRYQHLREAEGTHTRH